MTRRHDDEDDEALDRDGNRAILPDGMRLKVPLVSMDRAPPGFDPSRHRPGYRTVANCSDEVAMATLNEFLAHRDAADDPATKAYLEMVARDQERWRQGDAADSARLDDLQPRNTR
jgi:hypothetical protein